MSTDYSFEMNGNDRPNRFQVNPVNNTKKKSDETDGNDAYEEDTFNDDDITLRNNRRSSR